MQTDFLSASATLFAATLAYKLFNDWRQQFKAEMIERLKDRLFTNFKNMEAIYSQLCVSVDQNRFGTPNDNDLLKTSLLAEKVNDNIDVLIVDFDFYEKIIIQYKFESLIQIFPQEVKINLKKIAVNLFCGHIEVTRVSQYITELGKYIDENNDFLEALKHKKQVNEDMQKILLKLIDEQKGH